MQTHSASSHQQLRAFRRELRLGHATPSPRKHHKEQKKTDGKASRSHALIRGLRGGCPTFNTHIQLNFARRTQEVAHTNFPLILFFPPPSNPFALLAADPCSEKTTDRIQQMTTTGSTWNPRMQRECNQIMVSRCSRFRNPKPKKKCFQILRELHNSQQSFSRLSARTTPDRPRARAAFN